MLVDGGSIVATTSPLRTKSPTRWRSSMTVAFHRAGDLRQRARHHAHPLELATRFRDGFFLGANPLLHGPDLRCWFEI
jgi:hypothetical protein